MKIKFTILLALFLASQTSTLLAYPGESIVLDANGDYLITYWGGVRLMQTKHVPATKIEPTLTSTFKLGDAWLIPYRYTLANGQNAKQPISSIHIIGMTSIFSQQPIIPITSGMSPQAAIAALQSSRAPIITPTRWESLAGNEPDAPTKQVIWYFSTERYPNDPLIGVMPGTSQAGFGFASLDLPGVVAVRLEGYTPIGEGYKDEGPVPDSAIYQQLDQIERNNFVLRNAAAPMIPVPSPFDPAVTLERIQAHMHTWIDKQLLDAAFSAQLDTSFQAAITAYRSNQPLVGKQHVETLRAMIKLQQPDAESPAASINPIAMPPALIDLLAARILFFDLLYVTERGS